MAEVKETKTATKEEKIRVMAGTYPASGGDQARKLKESMKAAGFELFAVKPAEKMPGYIQVVAECQDKAAAEKLIKDAADKKIKLCITA